MKTDITLTTGQFQPCDKQERRLSQTGSRFRCCSQFWAQL